MIFKKSHEHVHHNSFHLVSRHRVSFSYTVFLQKGSNELDEIWGLLCFAPSLNLVSINLL